MEMANHRNVSQAISELRPRRPQDGSLSAKVDSITKLLAPESTKKATSLAERRLFVLRAFLLSAVMVIVVNNLDLDAIRPVCDFGNTSFDLNAYRPVVFFNAVA